MNNSALNSDPLDDDPTFAELIKTVEHQVEQELKSQKVKKSLGYCHYFWSLKKEILKKNYGLDWKSPAELNPDVMFD